MPYFVFRHPSFNSSIKRVFVCLCSVLSLTTQAQTINITPTSGATSVGSIKINGNITGPLGGTCDISGLDNDINLTLPWSEHSSIYNVRQTPRNLPNYYSGPGSQLTSTQTTWLTTDRQGTYKETPEITIDCRNIPSSGTPGLTIDFVSPIAGNLASDFLRIQSVLDEFNQPFSSNVTTYYKDSYGFSVFFYRKNPGESLFVGYHLPLEQLRTRADLRQVLSPMVTGVTKIKFGFLLFWDSSASSLYAAPPEDLANVKAVYPLTLTFN